MTDGGRGGRIYKIQTNGDEATLLAKWGTVALESDFSIRTIPDEEEFSEMLRADLLGFMSSRP